MLDDKPRNRADYNGPLDVPDDFEEVEGGEEAYGASLADDLVAFFEDGKTYAEAEIAFQKSRAAFTANRLKGAVAFALGAFGVFHLALIAFTVGAVIALMPLLGPWGATALVTAVLVLAGILLLRRLKSRLDDIRDAFLDDGHE